LRLVFWCGILYDERRDKAIPSTSKARARRITRHRLILWYRDNDVCEVGMMAFRRFDEKGKSFAPRVTISKSGYLNFSAGACRRFGLGQFRYVIFYFDEDTNRIGIGFTNNEEAPGARSLQTRDNSAGIYAKSFLDYHHISHEERQEFTPTYDEDEGLLVLGPVEMVDQGAPIEPVAPAAEANEKDARLTDASEF